MVKKDNKSKVNKASEEKPKEESEEVTDEAEEPVETKLVETKVPRFKNVGEGMKIKLVDGKKFRWITVKKGEVVTLPRKLALRNKLVEVE
jgi:hypothetical protein